MLPKPSAEAHMLLPLYFILGECHLVCRRRGQPDSAGPGEVQITSVRRGHSGCCQHGRPVQVEDWRAGV